MSKSSKSVDLTPDAPQDSGAASSSSPESGKHPSPSSTEASKLEASDSKQLSSSSKDTPTSKHSSSSPEMRSRGIRSAHDDLHEIFIKGKSTSERRMDLLSITKHVEHKLNHPNSTLEESCLSVKELKGLFQSPERGVFLMHQRSRQRIFLARIGLNRMSPTPETPVVRLELDAFLDYLAEEDPDLAHALRGRSLPEEVLILEQLSVRQLHKTSIQNVLWRYWTWLFVGELLGQWKKSEGSATALRIQIGHTAFEEIRSVLARGRYVFDSEDDEEVAQHFVSWWMMFGIFSPESRMDMFPSIEEESLDRWLEQFNLDIEGAIQRSKPRVDVDIPRQLPEHLPAPWLRWDLASKEAPSDDDIQPIRTEKLTRQPFIGAFLLLMVFWGMLAGLFYWVQNKALSRISESMVFIENLTGVHHFALEPYRPMILLLFVGGGGLLLFAAHMVDRIRMWWIQGALARSLTPVNPFSTDEERLAARTTCENHLRIWYDHFYEEAYKPTGRSALVDTTEALVTGSWDWIRMFVWGALISILPEKGFGVQWLGRFVARQQRQYNIFSFIFSIKRAAHERRCGNDSTAARQILSAITYYQRLQEPEVVRAQELEGHTEPVMLKLIQLKNDLAVRLTKRFEGEAPRYIAPTSGSFFGLLLFLLAVWFSVPTIQPAVFYLCFGFIFHALVAHVLDVRSSIRREVHFWREPAWRRYVLPDEIEEGRAVCLAHVQELQRERERDKKTGQQRPLIIEILSILWGMLRWWTQVRLWGHLITAFLFQWGKLVPLLRAAALQILRKQIFEFAYHLELAYHAEKRGNEAEAALQLTEAIAFYHPFVLDTENDLLLQELIQQRDALCLQIRDRFAKTHQITAETELDSLEEMIRELIDVPLSMSLGRQCAAALKTLQRSYLDKERDFFLTQLGRWILAFGRVPIQVGLAQYGLVRSLHYLQSMQQKINYLPLSEAQRARWMKPLDTAHHFLDASIRSTFGPKIKDAMEEAGFHAHNAQESVAQSKIREELLDLVIERGQFSFSDVRDVISRNDMRLSDPSWRQHLSGDNMIKLNRSFSTRFYEIYRRGEVYLRLLQRFSSLLFGTHLGRLLCRFLLIPFAGSTVILVFGAYLIGFVYKFVFKMKAGPGFVTFPAVFSLGVLIILIVHTHAGRQIFKQTISAIGNGIRFLFMEAPRWLIQRPIIQEALKHPRALFFYRQVALPAGLALFLFGIEMIFMMIFAWDFIHWTTVLSPFIFSCLLSYLFLNTPLGRAILDRLVYRWLYVWHQIKDRWVIGLIRMTIDGFRAMLSYLDYIIYRGDDVLRFHKGEGEHIILVKALGQLIWSIFTYVFRLLINLVVEPQVNPVKHFPVVTVSHKLISTMMGGVIVFLASSGITSPLIIGTVVISFQFIMPGLCGFLVWEFKENWKLFSANQPETLQAIRIGPHGETMEALLRRGFHSGTLPKTYEKLYQYNELQYLHSDPEKRRRLRENIHHVAEALEAFIHRDLLTAFQQCPSICSRFKEMGCEHPILGQNHIDLMFWMQVEGEKQQRYAWRLRIELEGTWMVGSIRAQSVPHDQANRLSDEEKDLLNSILVGFLRKSGVRLMRGKLEDKLSFYLRKFSVGVPGQPTGERRAEYRIQKEEVHVRLTGPNPERENVIYQLDEDGRLREEAPMIALESADPILR